MKAMKGVKILQGEMSFNDISPLMGVYSDFVYLKEHALVTIIQVTGINIDLMSTSEQNTLFDDYGTFLAQNAYYFPQTLSMTMPIKMGPYLMKWKKQYIQSTQNPEINENLRELRASYLYEYQKAETNLNLASKVHFVILKEKLKEPTLDCLHLSENKLKEKREEVMRSLREVLEKYDSQQEILNAHEALSVLHLFLDYKSSVYQ